MILKDRVAIVSGASRGIGRATAIALAEAGADVGINFYSHEDEAQEVAEIITKLGRRAMLLQGDVANLEVVEGLVERLVKEFGRLDIAVSNACYSDRQYFHQADVAGFERTINVTMWGAFWLMRAATQVMIPQGDGGSIVLVSSPHGYLPIPRSMAYNMSKAAVDHMAQTAAIELVDHRIRVNTMVPGWIDTPGERKFYSQEEIDKASPALPWKRLGTPEEIARGIVFLCDPASDYMTGSALRIDGGISLPWWAKGKATPD